MFQKKIIDEVLEAIERSPSGIVDLGILKSLRLCNEDTLKTTLSRLNLAKRIIRLKRGAYSTNPMQDPFQAAQTVFNGYLGFASALYLHKLITEIPFSISVVTNNVSKKKAIGDYQFQAIALKEKAVGFEKLGDYIVSSKAKTLFDCLYLPNYSVGKEKLVNAFKEARLSKEEWAEFDFYVRKFAGKKASDMNKTKKEIMGR